MQKSKDLGTGNNRHKQRVNKEKTDRYLPISKVCDIIAGKVTSCEEEKSLSARP